MRLVFALILLLPLQLCAQLGKQKNTKQYYAQAQVYDSTLGIFIYEKLNSALGGDSVRNGVSGYAAVNWWQDYYSNGQLLHEGFYVEGQLRIYKNYFESGKLERNFRHTDNNRCQMTIYYENGQIRSDIIYYQGEPETTYEYFEDGSPEFIEENAKKNEYPVIRKFYYAKNSPQSLLELTDKKKLRYSYVSYYENGKVEEEGTMQFNAEVSDVMKEGSWKVYDEQGKLVAVQEFVRGQMVEEKKM
ncbi:MAG: hypothetical protein MUC87_13630 [Bacteroidia bacterium]|jgi:antitoxin component YwqK of YwqJK toxin-antitoxin module|nr:hypothetical protein [Bacteroidia bacterium]